MHGNRRGLRRAGQGVLDRAGPYAMLAYIDRPAPHKVRDPLLMPS